MFEGSFDDLVKTYNLKPSFKLRNDEDGIFISEYWYSDETPDINAERFYYFDILFIDLIPIEIRFGVLEEILQIYVEIEEYENAAIIRDLIIILKGDMEL